MYYLVSSGSWFEPFMAVGLGCTRVDSLLSKGRGYEFRIYGELTNE